jgi:hypothetical protein
MSTARYEPSSQLHLCMLTRPERPQPVATLNLCHAGGIDLYAEQIDRPFLRDQRKELSD